MYESMPIMQSSSDIIIKCQTKKKVHRQSTAALSGIMKDNQ